MSDKPGNVSGRGSAELPRPPLNCPYECTMSILILLGSSKGHTIIFNSSASSEQREWFLGFSYLIYGIDSRICSLPCARAHPWTSRRLWLRGGCSLMIFLPQRHSSHSTHAPLANSAAQIEALTFQSYSL